MKTYTPRTTNSLLLHWSYHCLVPSILLLNTACATLTGRKEILSVDSKPRGLQVGVPDADRDFVATTPFFVEVNRSWNHKFKLEDNGSQLEQKVSCHFRWIPTLIGNAPLAIALTVTPSQLLTYGLSLGIDFASGAAWECDPRIILPIKNIEVTTGSAPPACERLVFIAVDADDHGTAWDYELAWNEYRRKNPAGCEQILTHERTDLAVAQLGLAQISSNEVHEKLQERALELGYETGATHFLLVSAKGDNSSRNYRAEKIDAHRLETVATVEWNSDQYSTRKKGQTSFLKKSRPFVLLFVPNSLGYSASKMTLEGVEKGEKVSSADSASGPTLTNVQHPAQYDPWDLAFDLAPQGSLQYLNLSPESVAAEHAASTAKTLAFEVSGSFSGRMTGHYPIGAISIDLGFGAVGFMTKNAKRGNWNSTAAPFLVAGLGYRAFISDRTFIQLYFSQLRPLSTLKISSENRISSIKTATATLGYYLPEMPMWMGRKL